MGLVAIRADLKGLAGKEKGLVRAMGPVADGAAAIPSLFRVKGLRGPEALFHLSMAGEAESPLPLGQEPFHLGGMGVMAGRALAAVHRGMNLPLLQLLGHSRMAGETELLTGEEGLPWV